MATLDRLTFWLDIKGAEKVQKTLENIQKATYAETKSAISALLEPIRRKEREERSGCQKKGGSESEESGGSGGKGCGEEKEKGGKEKSVSNI